MVHPSFVCLQSDSGNGTNSSHQLVCIPFTIPNRKKFKQFIEGNPPKQISSTPRRMYSVFLIKYRIVCLSPWAQAYYPRAWPWVLGVEKWQAESLLHTDVIPS